MPSGFNAFCAQVLQLDKGIRFAGIAGKDGYMMGHVYRKGVEPLLTTRETELSVLQSVIRNGMRTTLEKKMGRTLYSLTVYRKVKRATIPVKSESDQLQIRMVSFDTHVNAEQIIIDEILPLLDELIV